MKVAALDVQKGLRDLKGLPKLVDTVYWISLPEAAHILSPLIICGLLAAEQPEDFAKLVKQRLDLGLGVLIVPRLRSCQIGDLLGTPEAIDIIHAEFADVSFGREIYRIPGSLVFNTNLHAGRISSLPGFGAQLFLYRPTTAKGTVILCGASLTSFRSGAEPAHQKILLHNLLGLLQPTKTTEPEEIKKELKEIQLSAADLLTKEPQGGALVLMAILNGAEKKEEDVVEKLRLIGLTPDLYLIQSALKLLSNEITIQDATKALVKAGWGSYVRRLQQANNHTHEKIGE